MEAKDLFSGASDLIKSAKEDVANLPVSLKREIDSLDDFEHLTHDTSPIKGKIETIADDVASHAREIGGIIDKGVESAQNTVHNVADMPLFDPLENTTASAAHSLLDTAKGNRAMDSNRLEFDMFAEREPSDKILADLTGFDLPKTEEKKDDMKSATLNFMESEREINTADVKQAKNNDDILDHYSDSDPEDDFKHAETHDFLHKNDELPELSSKNDMFKDVHDFDAKFDNESAFADAHMQEPLIPEIAKKIEPKASTPEPEVVKEIIQEVKEQFKQEERKAVDPKVEEIKEEAKKEEPKFVKEESPKLKKVEEQKKPAKDIIEVEEMFCKMGLGSDADEGHSVPHFGTNITTSMVKLVESLYTIPNQQEQGDMCPKIYETKAIIFLTQLHSADLVHIEANTKQQSKSDLWTQERRVRLTASNFGRVHNMRSTTSSANFIKSLLYNTFTGNRYTAYGQHFESTALKLFENLHNVKTTPAGLVVYPEKPFLAASPDAFVENESAIVEIKCPFKAQNLTPKQAVIMGLIKCCSIINGEMKLNSFHKYMYQVQGQLLITNRDKCYFVIWTPHGINVEVIFRDDELCNIMLNRLEKFYLGAILPELIDPRHTRDLPFRDFYLN